MSAHHYFRDFFYCDSGMIPWLLVMELVSTTGKSLRVSGVNSLENLSITSEINSKLVDAVCNRACACCW